MFFGFVAPSILVYISYGYIYNVLFLSPKKKKKRNPKISLKINLI